MLCDKCNRNQAVYHLKSIVNGQSKEEHLCSICAEHYNSSFASFVSSIFDETIFGIDMIGFEDALCDCGTKFSDIAMSGQVGCDNCYASYKNILNEAIKSINIGAEKTRKKMLSGDFRKEQKINELKSKIAEAVEVEDYELASSLKKEIDALKEGDDVQ